VKKYSPDFFYHIAEPANLASIHRIGLLSTEQLIKMTGLDDAALEIAVSQHRPDQIVLSNGVVIRDQSPMPPKALARVLSSDLRPADWYRFLNTFVFLWANRERVDRHLGAFGERRQALLIFDAARLLREKADQLLVSPINSGNAMRRAAYRSRNLFVPYATWLKSGWPLVEGQSRNKSTLPVEIVVKDRLPLNPYLLKVEYLK
jgi:Family of unknown function (DUF7002)